MSKREDALEIPSGLRVYVPGETVPVPHVPATPRKYKPGTGPLDDPPARPIIQVGRRVTTPTTKGWG